MCARTGSRILRASSGSRSASSSIEPLRSANRTVTCFRSPSSAAFAVRIRAARCFGVYASGDAGGDAIAAPAGVTRSPHSRQNFADAGSSVRQFEQLTTRRAPHSRQNFACAGFSWRHAGHCTGPYPCQRGASWVATSSPYRTSPSRAPISRANRLIWATISSVMVGL